ncbi:MAG: peptidoglycan-binding protein [Candidatus Omnitrophota bacterium]
MGKRMVILVGLVVMISGCATTAQDQSMVTQLQLRIGELEREVQMRDQRISDLEYEVKDLSYDIKKMKDKPKSTSSMTSSMPAKVEGETIRLDVDHSEVQRALKAAGYYEGAIDGKVGPGTKAAITQFQKDNGLTADGLLGRQTWTALQKYLN